MVKKYYLQIRDWFSRRTARFYYSLFVVLTVGSFLPFKTSALSSAATIVIGDLSGYVLRLLLWIFYWLFIACMGKIATIGMKLVIWTSSFANLTTMPAVNQTWIIVRNFSNLFFLLALLIIAFATILKIESYSYKKLLPKMILAAVLINFSKLICSVLVDASQIVMLTFVNAFKGAATQSLYYSFKLDQLVSITNPYNGSSYGGEGSWSEADYFIGTVAAGAMITFMAVLMFTFAIILCARVVFIWTLTILSPFAFATSILPATQKYSQQWWSTFGRYVVVGPFLAFFIWLAMFIVVKAGTAGMAANLSGGISITSTSTPSSTTTTSTYSAGQAQTINSGANGIGSLEPTVIVNYLIATMMLLIGLQFSQQMATEIGGITGKVGNIPKSFAKGFGKILGKGYKEVAKGAADRIYKTTGFDLNLARQWELLKQGSAGLSKQRVTEGQQKAEKAVKSGGVWGAMHVAGAAGTWYEHMMPFIGKQGLLMGRRSLLRGGITSLQHGSADEEKEELDKKGVKIGEAESAEREEIQKQFGLTAEEKATRNQELDSQKSELLATSTYLDDNQQIDSSQSDVNTAIQGRMSQLDTEIKEKKKNGQDTQAEEDQLKELKGALDVNGIVTLKDATRRGVGDHVDNQIRKLTEEQTKISGANNCNDPLARAMALNDVNTKYDGQKKSLNDEQEVVQKRLRETAVISDPEEDKKIREMMEEKKKDIHSNNEEELKNLLLSAIAMKDGIKALAVLSQAAQVGHLNEMTKVLGYNSGMDGWKQMMKEVFIKGGSVSKNKKRDGLHNLGLDDQLVLSVCNEASRSAEGINHWAFSQAVNNEHGHFKWYDEPVRQQRIYTEASKKSFIPLMQEGNRLAWGEHYIDEDGEEKWRMMPAMAALMAKNMTKEVLQGLNQGRYRMNTSTRDNFLENPEQFRMLMQGAGRFNKDSPEALKIAITVKPGQATAVSRDVLLDTMKKELNWNVHRYETAGSHH